MLLLLQVHFKLFAAHDQERWLQVCEILLDNLLLLLSVQYHTLSILIKSDLVSLIDSVLGAILAFRDHHHVFPAALLKIECLVHERLQLVSCLGYVLRFQVWCLL